MNGSWKHVVSLWLFCNSSASNWWLNHTRFNSNDRMMLWHIAYFGMVAKHVFKFGRQTDNKLCLCPSICKGKYSVAEREIERILVCASMKVSYFRFFFQEHIVFRDVTVASNPRCCKPACLDTTMCIQSLDTYYHTELTHFCLTAYEHITRLYMDVDRSVSYYNDDHKEQLIASYAMCLFALFMDCR